MTVTPGPQDPLPSPQSMRPGLPLAAAALVLAVVGFTSWFWAQEESLLDLLPLYLVAAFFCADTIFLSRRLRAKSKDLY